MQRIGVSSSKWDIYMTIIPARRLKDLCGRGAERSHEPEVVDGFRKTVFSRHSSSDEHMN